MTVPPLDCNKQLYITESFVEFIYDDLDIDSFDHCQFLFDTEELILEDEIIGHYHANIRKCKSTFFFNKKPDLYFRMNSLLFPKNEKVSFRLCLPNFK